MQGRRRLRDQRTRDQGTKREFLAAFRPKLKRNQPAEREARACEPKTMMTSVAWASDPDSTLAGNGGPDRLPA